ncbi:hypothetical protein CCHR01_19844 [Colletotrichum chrysophilum]|uniref:Uncharacterized protein n=1 Tax=Colletotrichum chrysophilum TaxID=1836956 RepID=A0AAD8ZXL2_9PEZI|nr:hypothetical protein CCHR01_19844 [Colletotrichum chrysophilum]
MEQMDLPSKTPATTSDLILILILMDRRKHDTQHTTTTTQYDRARVWDGDQDATGKSGNSSPQAVKRGCSRPIRSFACAGFPDERAAVPYSHLHRQAPNALIQDESEPASRPPARPSDPATRPPSTVYHPSDE